MKRYLMGIVSLISLFTAAYADQPSSTDLHLEDNISLIPRKILFSDPDRGAIALSPNGSKISYCEPVKGVLNIWAGPIDDLKAIRPITNDARCDIIDYKWAYTNDHMLYIQDPDNDANWQIFCLNLSSGKIENLASFEGAGAEIEAMSPKYPKDVIIGLNNRNHKFWDLYRSNITTGNLTLLMENNEFLRFYIDDNYVVRLASKMAPEGGREIFKRTEDGSWESFMKIDAEDARTTGILGFDKTGSVAYMWDSRNRNTAALYALNLDTGEKRLIAEDARADLSADLPNP